MAPLSQTGEAVAGLVEVMRRLLAPDGCPWDREQSLASLRPYLLEETFEVLAAIDEGTPDEHREELGDLLLQIVFQAALREGEGRFGIDDVARAITDKMRRRHPHVFGEVKVDSAAEVSANWARAKAEERARKAAASGAPRPPGLLDGVPRAAPALLQAQRVGEKAAQVGFDWPDVQGVRDKLDEELGELDEAMASGAREAIAEELGDVLFTLTRLGSKLGVPPEDALREATLRFRARFAHMEDEVARSGHDLAALSLDELDLLWRAAKKATRRG